MVNLAHLTSVARLTLEAILRGEVNEEQVRIATSNARSAAEVAARVIPRWTEEVKRETPSLFEVCIGPCKMKCFVGAFLIGLRSFSTAFFMPMLLDGMVREFAAENVAGATNTFLVLIAERSIGLLCEVAGFLMAQSVVTEFTTALQCIIMNKICTTPGIENLADEIGINPQALIGSELSLVHAKLSATLPLMFQSVPWFVAGIVGLLYLLGPSAAIGAVWAVFLIHVNWVVNSEY